MIWIVLAIIAFDVGFATLLVWAMIRGNWHPLLRSFPARPPADGAVGRRFQSFRLGLMNLGGCIHVAADEFHLHLTPVRVLQWLSMRPVSIPWEAIELRGSRAGRRYREARILGKHVLGPAWCLDLADPERDARAS
jgi:hypothetical protein